MRIHILPKVSCGNDQFSTKFQSKLIVSFAEGSGKYKIISLLFWLLAKNSTKYIGEKNGKFEPKRVPESTSNEDKHYMICSTTKLMYNVLQIRVAKCLCSTSRKVVLKEGMMLDVSNL